MATCRAIMKDIDSITGVSGTGFTWTIHWIYFALDGTRYADIITSTPILTGDTAATIATKVTDSIVAYATAKADTLARTDVYLISYNRSS